METRSFVGLERPGVVSVSNRIAQELGHGDDGKDADVHAYLWGQVCHPGASAWRSCLEELIKRQWAARPDWPSDDALERAHLEHELHEHLTISGLQMLHGRAQQLWVTSRSDPAMLTLMCALCGQSPPAYGVPFFFALTSCVRARAVTTRSYPSPTNGWRWTF